MNYRMVFLLTVFWMGLMFFGSSIPSFSTREITEIILDVINKLAALLPGWLTGNSPISAGSYSCFNMVIRKIGHFIEYQILSVLLLKLFVNIKNTRHPYILSGLVTIAFAFLDEFYQSTVPHRSPLLVDVLVDTAGVLTALVLARICAKL